MQDNSPMHIHQLILEILIKLYFWIQYEKSFYKNKIFDTM